MWRSSRSRRSFTGWGLLSAGHGEPLGDPELLSGMNSRCSSGGHRAGGGEGQVRHSVFCGAMCDFYHHPHRHPWGFPSDSFFRHLPGDLSDCCLKPLPQAVYTLTPHHCVPAPGLPLYPPT